MLLPVVMVKVIKQTRWGPTLAAPRARQLGNPQAKVAIIEYSDFQCPSCAHLQPTVHQFLDLYKDKVRLVYKYYPLTKVHRNALGSAQAAQCASLQNQFWPYADRLFATQPSWAELTDPTTTFMAMAQDLRLDAPRFRACLADPSQREPILQDVEEGQARQVRATPTFLIGDERLVGNVLATDGARAIEKALRR